MSDGKASITDEELVPVAEALARWGIGWGMTLDKMTERNRIMYLEEARVAIEAWLGAAQAAREDGEDG